MEKGMRSFKDLLLTNVIWVITTLVAIGAYAATVKYQGDSITECNKTLVTERERIVVIEKNLIRLEAMQSDLKEMKEDIKEIKKIVLKPIVSSVDFPNAKIVSASAK